MTSLYANQLLDFGRTYPSETLGGFTVAAIPAVLQPKLLTKQQGLHGRQISALPVQPFYDLLSSSAGVLPVMLIRSHIQEASSGIHHTPHKLVELLFLACTAACVWNEPPFIHLCFYRHSGAVSLLHQDQTSIEWDKPPLVQVTISTQKLTMEQQSIQPVVESTGGIHGLRNGEHHYDQNLARADSSRGAGDGCHMYFVHAWALGW